MTLLSPANLSEMIIRFLIFRFYYEINIEESLIVCVQILTDRGAKLKKCPHNGAEDS